MSPSESTLVGLEEPDLEIQKLHLNGGTQRNAQTPKSLGDARAIVDSLMKERFSCRYFLPMPVPRNFIEEIIDVARFSPSGNNIQPWEKVYCISGSVFEAITADMLKGFQDDPTAHKAQYDYYPPKGLMPEVYAKRHQEAGKLLSVVLNIERTDYVARAKAAGRNFQFYNAPVAFIFTIDKALTQGSWLDIGYFLQSISIAARARGLETVSMESVARYQAIFRRYLPIGEDSIVAVGMTMGYPDVEKATRFWAPQPRREVWDIIQFFS